MVESIRTKQKTRIAELTKRLANLSTRPKAELTETEIAELKYGQELLTYLKSNSDQKEEINTKLTSIKNSTRESWYLNQMLYWAQQHPEELENKLGKSSLYKFALHFFVENVALQSTNASLTVDQLERKITMPTKEAMSRVTLQTKINNLESLMSFQLSLMQRSFQFEPESIVNDLILKTPHPITEKEIELTGLETELNAQSDLGRAYKKYQEIRHQDLAQLQKMKGSKKGNLLND